MKQFFAFLFLVTITSCLSAQSISINNPADPETSLSAEELIRQVFVNGGCGEATLINVQANTVSPQDLGNKSWGYFDRNGSNFPFSRGIILSSGIMSAAEGPNTAVGSGTGNGDWAGDSDLQSVLNQQNGGDLPTTNATVFEFTFIPLTDVLNFDFIYASEEYQNQPGAPDFECNDDVRDGFAFLLRGPGIANDSGTAFGGTNLATLQNVNDLPVNSQSIHANDFRCGDEVENTNFYPEFYRTNYVNSANSQAIEFDGYTRSFNAESTVTSGEEYTIKIVIGDRSDNILDSAIFLSADSFTIGLDLGPDITQDSGNTLCEGEEIVLDISSSTTVNDAIRWFRDGMELMGETGQMLSVFQSGIYTVEIDYVNGCTGTDDILVEYAITPVAQDANDFRVCNVDGEDVQFDLRQNDAVILGGQDPAAFRIAYHTTLDFAERDIRAIPNATRYEPISNPQTIYARIEDVATQQCFDIITFTISLGVADIGLLDDFSVCDVLNDGSEIFDLTLNDENALNGEDPNAYNITYYVNPADAEAGNNAIPDPTNFGNTQSPQTIYLRMENLDDEDCFNTASFQIDVAEVEVGLLDNLGVCSGDGNTSFDLTVNDIHAYNGLNRETFSVTYHESQADANTGANPIMTPEGYIPGTVPRTIFTRLESNMNSDCFDTRTFMLSTDGAVAGSPNNLGACDLDGDGIELFDLSLNDEDVLLGQDSDEYTVTYHISQADADTGDSPLSVMYTNTVSPEEIFARIENVADPSCFDTNVFELIVSIQPEVETLPNDLESCDEGGGMGTYNLDANTALILGTQDPMQYNVEYFENQEDADDNVNSIRFKDNYQNTIPSDGLEIIARIHNSDNVSCYETVSFTLNLSDVIIGDMVLLDRCRQNNMTPLFDLTENDVNALSNVFANNYVVTYYENLPNAEAGANALLDPENYRARGDRQIVFARIENINNEECFDVGEFVLNISLANLGTLVRLGVCAPEGDETEFFDLTLNTPNAITGQGADEVTVTYHLNPDDAMQDINPIDNPEQYENLSNPQTIHLRIESNENEDCYNTGDFEIRVSQQPLIIDEPEDFLNCDGNMQFDLTQNDILIRGNQNALLFEVKYYETLLQAQSGGNPIPNPSNYTQNQNPQTIFARIENVENGNCSELEEFVIESVNLQVGPVITLNECDLDGNGEEIFDLSENDINALNGLNPDRYMVTYHISQMDADTGDSPLSTMYTNTVNPEPIFVRLEEPNFSDCVATDSFLLQLNPLPAIVMPTPLQSCDDDNDGFFAFNLQSKDDEISQSNPNYIVSYFESFSQAEQNMDALTSPYTNITAFEQTVQVRVEDMTTTCVSYTTLDLEVYETPMLSADDYEVMFCETEDGTPNSFSFNNSDVTDSLPNLLTTSQDNVSVTYHFNPTEADSGDNPIPDGFEFDQTMHNPIFIRVENSNSPQPCYNVDNLASLTISINTNPQFSTMQIDPIFLCADEPGNQNLSTMFNLTDRESQINTTGNPDVVVVYYASLEDFNMGNAIPNGEITMYANISNPQTIVAELFNEITNCRSEETVEFDLIVQPLPILPGQLQSPQGTFICVDAQGNLDEPFQIGYDLGAIDGEEYRYDWTPDNVDSDNDGFEDAIYTISNISEVTTFSLTITHINDEVNGMPNCSNSVDPVSQNNYSVTFEPVFPIQSLSVTVAEPAFSFPNGYTVTLTPTLTNTIFVVGDYQYQIDDGPLQDSNVFFNVAPGQHSARIINIAGCDEVITSFSIIDYPRFFTPNNDGFNDFWNIISIDKEPEAKIYIFDRYGKLLKQLSSQGAGWDGTYNGRQVPSSDYWFSVQYLDENINAMVEFKASFTLKR